MHKISSTTPNLPNIPILPRAPKLITSARRQGTISNYELAWGKWPRWCGDQMVDLVRSSINYALDFLAYLFGMEFEYSTINSHRLANSAHHNYVKNSTVG